MYATRAVGLTVEEAFSPLQLGRLEAVTTPSNVGSQIVLLRNGFAFVARTPRALQLNGKWHDTARRCHRSRLGSLPFDLIPGYRAGIGAIVRQGDYRVEYLPEWAPGRLTGRRLPPSSAWAGSNWSRRS